MSTRKQLNATPQIRHPHLKLVSLMDETIASAKEPDAMPSSSVGRYLPRDLLLGLALMGTALHASPEAIAMQSHILASAGGKKRTRAGFLLQKWQWLIRWKLLECLCRKKTTVPGPSGPEGEPENQLRRPLGVETTGSKARARMFNPFFLDRTPSLTPLAASRGSEKRSDISGD